LQYYYDVSAATGEMDLLLSPVDTEIINVVDTCHPLGEQGASREERLSQGDTVDQGETQNLGGRKPVAGIQWMDGVTYGTVFDLLYFVNLISNGQTESLAHLARETGVLLNKADLVPKEGRYRINSDVFLFPWKPTFRNPWRGHVPKGTFGRVHLAQDTETGKRMACKLIPLKDFRSSEVEIQARLRHTNVAQLYGAVLWNGTVHLFMEAAEGGSVQEKLDTWGPMRETEIIWITKQILGALDYLHCRRVIHHDTKPSNIVLMSSKAVLVDFGLSVQMSGDIFYPKDFRGTEMYMSPEVVVCRGHNTKADIYSLGATIIHMQTGYPPWVRRYPRPAYPSYLYIIHKQAPPLEDIADDCSPAMRSFLQLALERHPGQRGTAKRLLRDKALHPLREQHPRCWSLDSVLGEGSRHPGQQRSQLCDTLKEDEDSLFAELDSLGDDYAPLRTPPASGYG
uniref:Mitogen-activated protein kinase kinase kinase 8 n=1 Tax=Scleropages formosus TaxID=113540 RepID=A0A8C9R6F8_SCLFO